MALTILDCTITSDHTPHTARRATDHPRNWEVSWLPGRHLTRNEAITAMALAEVCPAAARGGNWERMRPHVQGWAAELGLTAEQAITRITALPDRAAAAESGPVRPDPEAGA
jgi:hypothetical protein